MSTSEHILETTRPVTALKKSSFFFRATGRPQKGSGEETEGGGEGQKEGGEGERAKFGAGWPDGHKNLPGAWKGLWKDGIGISW